MKFQLQNTKKMFVIIEKIIIKEFFNSETLKMDKKDFFLHFFFDKDFKNQKIKTALKVN